MDKNEEKVISEMDGLLRRNLAACQAQTEMETLLQCRRLVVLRSCPMPVFTGFLKELNALYRKKKMDTEAQGNHFDFQLMIIGKETDATFIEQNWSGLYELAGIEGSYTYEKMIHTQGVWLTRRPEKVLFFSRVLSDENYMNIYEAVEQMDAECAICYNFNSVLTEITDMKKYMTTLRLWLAVGAWYWERNR